LASRSSFGTDTSNFVHNIESIMILKKALKTSEDLEDNMMKGEQKVKALIKRCYEDSDENKI